MRSLVLTNSLITMAFVASLPLSTLVPSLGIKEKTPLPSDGTRGFRISYDPDLSRTVFLEARDDCETLLEDWSDGLSSQGHIRAWPMILGPSLSYHLGQSTYDGSKFSRDSPCDKTQVFPDYETLTNNLHLIDLDHRFSIAPEKEDASRFLAAYFDELIEGRFRLPYLSRDHPELYFRHINTYFPIQILLSDQQVEFLSNRLLMLYEMWLDYLGEHEHVDFGLLPRFLATQNLILTREVHRNFLLLSDWIVGLDSSEEEESDDEYSDDDRSSVYLIKRKNPKKIEKQTNHLQAFSLTLLAGFNPLSKEFFRSFMNWRPPVTSTPDDQAIFPGFFLGDAVRSSLELLASGREPFLRELDELSRRILIHFGETMMESVEDYIDEEREKTSLSFALNAEEFLGVLLNQRDELATKSRMISFVNFVGEDEREEKETENESLRRRSISELKTRFGAPLRLEARLSSH